MDLAPILARIDAQRAEIDALRPLPADQLGRAMQRLRLEWTYHSNAIEGNQLTYGETRALLLHGVTAQGKPLKDHLDIKGHREALDYLERFVRSEEPLTLINVRELHRLLLGDTYEHPVVDSLGRPGMRVAQGGAFKEESNHVRTATGETHYYATPEETPARMRELIDRLRDEHAHVEDGTLHPVVYAAAFHHRFVAIHPFPDGNGRMARLLMNLVLMRAGYVPAVVRQEAREAYYGVLAQADGGELAPFTAFIAEELAATMTLFLRAVRGEPDPDEFDRRIALLAQEAEGVRRAAEAISWNPEQSTQAYRRILKPLWDDLRPRIQQVRALFSRSVIKFVATYPGTIITYSEPEEKAAWTQLEKGDWRSFQIECLLYGYLANGRMSDRIALEVVLDGRRGRVVTYPQTS
ncbi:MAG: Fic family protein, partial [Bacteroidota bacterium]